MDPTWKSIYQSIIIHSCTETWIFGGQALVAVDFHLITEPNFRHFKRWRHKIIASAENIKKTGLQLQVGPQLEFQFQFKLQLQLHLPLHSTPVC